MVNEQFVLNVEDHVPAGSSERVSSSAPGSASRRGYRRTGPRPGHPGPPSDRLYGKLPDGDGFSVCERVKSAPGPTCPW